MTDTTDRRRAMLRRIRWVLGGFVVGLVLSGLTAIPLEREVDLLAAGMGIPVGASPGELAGLRQWIAAVREGIHQVSFRYPFMAYGTDWLAFAHVVIAVAFLGPLRDPVRNVWVITFGMVACAMVIPMALVFGYVRDIPLGWRIIDCCFGVVGFLPLWAARRWTMDLARVVGW